MRARVVTLGEIMLRLKPPGFERFLQSPRFEATFGGGEANVAVSLARFGVETAFVTALPNNPIAEACIGDLRRYGVDTSHIVRSGERIGIYFLEAGANQRPSNVIYDRAHSSIATLGNDSFQFGQIFKGADWFHITGITPALSETAAELTLEAVRSAKENGLTVSCDYNYRSKLWKYGKTAPEVMREVVKWVDVGIANEEDCQRSLGITTGEGDWAGAVKSGDLDQAKYEALCERVMEAYPNLDMQAITLRESHSASHNSWSACLHNGEDFFVAPRYEVTHIVDRVGGGDSFAAGLIYGLITGMEDRSALHFAAAASCLKHSIVGDKNLSTVPEVQNLTGGDSSGRVRR